MTEPRPTRHLAFLDGVRGLASLYVVWRHIDIMVWFKVYPPAWFPLLRFWLLGARYAVSLFMVVSGFCMMLPLLESGGALRGGALTFYRRRAIRILPPYYFAVALCMLLGATLFAHDTGSIYDRVYPPTRLGLWTHLVLLQNWAPFFHPDYAEAAHSTFALLQMGPAERDAAIAKMVEITDDQFSIDTPLWTVAIEVQLYLLFPLLAWVWRRYGPGATMLLSGCSFVFYVFHHSPLDGWMAPHFIFLFAAGMLTAQIAYGEGERWQRWRDKPWGWVAAVGFLIIFVLYYLAQPAAVALSYLLDLPAAPASMALLIAASREGRLQSFLSRRVFVFVGSFCYSLYLVHEPVIHGLEQYVLAPLAHRPLWQFALLAGPGVVLSCAVAYGFHLLCERPFMTARARAALPVLKRGSAPAE